MIRHTIIHKIFRKRYYNGSTPEKLHNDFVQLGNKLQKKQAWNERRRQLHKWNNRAKAVNIDPLPARPAEVFQELLNVTHSTQL